MTDLVFTSVAFGHLYIEQQRRLRQSILSIYPEANILFFEGRLPDKSRSFADSLYGFKIHAIAEAADRYKKIVWLDPAMILTRKIDKIFNYPMVAVKDESKLYQCISDKFLNYLDYTRDEIKEKDWHLVGGSLYYFDFTKIVAEGVFESWKDYEENGWFGSQKEQASEQINSHRNDESCMAISIYEMEIEPVTPEEVGYCIEGGCFSKKHFK